jgi:biopolymer transport protein ExbD
MAEKRRFLDVWIVDSNTVYKEVPFTVVADWVEQGRLLEDDMVKPSGTKEWMRLGSTPELQPYVPRPLPDRVEDVAEAQEPMGGEFAFKKRGPEDEDEDVDMIPLIDVSLVLLVFFMLSASAAAMASFVQVPETEYGQMADNPGVMRIDISLDENDKPLYALGVGDAPPSADEGGKDENGEPRPLTTLAALLDRLKARLARSTSQVEVVINADKRLPARIPRDVLLALRAEPFRSKVSANYFGVSEKQDQ